MDNDKLDRHDGSLHGLKVKRFPIVEEESLSSRATKDIQAQEDAEISQWFWEMSIVFPIMED